MAAEDFSGRGRQSTAPRDAPPPPPAPLRWLWPWKLPSRQPSEAPPATGTAKKWSFPIRPGSDHRRQRSEADIRLDEEALRRSGLNFAAAVAQEYREAIVKNELEAFAGPCARHGLRTTILECLEFDTFGKQRVRRFTRQELLEELRHGPQEITEQLSPRHRLAEDGAYAGESGGNVVTSVGAAAPDSAVSILPQALDLDVSHGMHRVNAPAAADNDAAAVEAGAVQKKPLTKYERVQYRDIRLVDPAFSSEQVLVVRDNAILVVLDNHMRAIIQATRLFLFDHRSARAVRAAQVVSTRLQSVTIDEYAPFEFVVLESLLIAVYADMEETLSHIEPLVQRDLQELSRVVNTRRIERLRLDVRRLALLASRSRGVMELLDQVLDEDEDMSQMYLTEKRYQPELPRHPLDHEHVEILLESYFQMFQSLVRRVELLDHTVDDTQSVVEIKLDTVQNRLLSFTVVQHVLTALFFGLVMVADVFGMNLNCPWYNITDTVAPWVGTVVGSVALGAVALVACLYWLSRRGMLFGIFAYNQSCLGDVSREALAGQ
ncbi:hypothetical protein CDCA_CDCA07G2082 [Cyanidium caldarium]|uniref:Magnesium transporter n=1 Tax=Cyanidium caldarium TaxID=2771 RepID=A0AAV9IUP5_CYACA|nr:hypothetical protein CDCA_CDCA07G2082 [Cyanidium caldarium]